MCKEDWSGHKVWGLGGDWDVGKSIFWTLVLVIYYKKFSIPSLLAMVGSLEGMLITYARGV